MTKIFNTAGHCKRDIHYMIDPIPRFADVNELIDAQKYFVIHAPRQSGKTTLLYELTNKLNKAGKYTALNVNIQAASIFSDDVPEGMKVIISAIMLTAKERLPVDEQPNPPTDNSSGSYLIVNMLNQWAKKNPKPIVLFIDEADSIHDNLFLSLLHQLRSGYELRPGAFPQSIALVGLRDVRDYKIRIRPESESLGKSSPFNIKSESLTMSNFTGEEIASLYKQHTDGTGQIFSEEAIQKAFELTGGQPWLVNALAAQVVYKILKKNYSVPVTVEHILQAKEELILRRDTHLDSLIDKLREERVKRVIIPILTGESTQDDPIEDDIMYVKDLGLIRNDRGRVEIANPIYNEVIPRALTWASQQMMYIEESWYIKPDGKLNMDEFLKGFQKFFRRHAESWVERFDYREAGPQLLLQAYLHRVVNTGGAIEREFAVGSGRADLCVKYQGDMHALELKLYYDNYTESEGLEQLNRYLDQLDLKRGYLVIFDLSKTKSWEEKLYWKEVEYEGKRIAVVGM
ncbi:AAA family ATPase [Candidatus Poribacteria bacterium]|nr:AAA family ATPase [Candidatus Poribacteria bacterium]